MSEENHKQYYDVLELSPGASIIEIIKAYKSLKELYSVDSIVTAPISDEFLDDKRMDILNQIEEAYVKLLGMHIEAGIDIYDHEGKLRKTG